MIRSRSVPEALFRVCMGRDRGCALTNSVDGTSVASCRYRGSSISLVLVSVYASVKTGNLRTTREVGTGFPGVGVVVIASVPRCSCLGHTGSTKISDF